MSRRTAEVYAMWVRRYLHFCAAARGEWTPPERLATADVEAFLNHLVGERHLSASSQNQALNALVFHYRHVLENAIAPDHPSLFSALGFRGSGFGAENFHHARSRGFERGG